MNRWLLRARTQLEERRAGGHGSTDVPTCVFMPTCCARAASSAYAGPRGFPHL